MTNHHMSARSAYCTDFTIGYTGIVNESLMYSNSNVLEILPLKINYWNEGSINGLMARCKAEVSIKWNKESIEVTIKTTDDTLFTVKNENDYSSISKNDVQVESGEILLSLEKNEEVQLKYILK